MAIGRQIIGSVVGIAAAGGIIAVTEAIGHGAASGEAIFGTAIAGYGIGCAVGTFIATMIAGGTVSMVLPVILAILVAINLFSFPHPWWFAPAGVIALGTGWLFGRSLAVRLAERRTLSDRVGR